ncbi:MAG: CHAT domain-containing protein [Acidobacteriota bacterium]
MDHGSAPAASPGAPKRVPERFGRFVLSIEKVGESYRARVADSPQGKSQAVSLAPAAVSTIAAAGPHRGSWELSPPGGGDRQSLEQAGDALFQAVFTDDVATAFRTSLDGMRRRGWGLCVHIQLDGAPGAVHWPWEALWDREARAFLADISDVPVVRSFSVKPQVTAVGPGSTPLQILGMLPRPQGSVALSGDREWRAIEEHLGDLVEGGRVAIERVEPATLGNLGRRLEEGPCDVLHVIAHGQPGVGGLAAGAVELEGESRAPDWVSGTELSRALERPSTPRLVVLSSCYGAASAPHDAFDGLAQQLITRGVPAVVAMRTRIRDKAAVTFASALYRHLSRGRSVEAAMIEARRELGLSKDRAEWSIPVLYLRKDDEDGSTQLLAPVVEDGAGGWGAGLGKSRAARWVAAVVAAAALGWFGWARLASSPSPPSSVPPMSVPARLVPVTPESVTPAPSEACPAPSGVRDMEFALIEPGTVEIEGQTLTVEKAYCTAKKELSRRDYKAIYGHYPWRDGGRNPLWPASNMTVAEAREGAALLNVREPGANYRVPTRIQWEFAARAGATTRFFFGDDAAELSTRGRCGDDRGFTNVGSYPPNAWGLHDVHGNVAELVEWDAELTAEARQAQSENKIQRMGGHFENALDNCSFDAVSTIDDRRKDGESGLRLIRDPVSVPQS